MQLSKLMKDNLEKAEEQELTSSNNLLLQVGNALKSLPADKVAKASNGVDQIHSITLTAEDVENDDFVVIDGETKGSRKFQAEKIAYKSELVGVENFTLEGKDLTGVKKYIKCLPNTNYELIPSTYNWAAPTSKGATILGVSTFDKNETETTIISILAGFNETSKKYSFTSPKDAKKIKIFFRANNGVSVSFSLRTLVRDSLSCSEKNEILLNGKNLNLIGCGTQPIRYYFDCIPSTKYVVNFLNPGWDDTGVAGNRINISTYDSNGVETNFLAKNDSNVSENFEFTTPANAEQIRIFVRASVNTDVNIFVSANLTNDLKEIKNKLTIKNFSLFGNDRNSVYSSYYEVIPGECLSVRISPISWELGYIASGTNRIYAIVYDSNKQFLDDLIFSSDKINRIHSCYKIKIPQNACFIRFRILAEKNKKIEFEVSKISELEYLDYEIPQDEIYTLLQAKVKTFYSEKLNFAVIADPHFDEKAIKSANIELKKRTGLVDFALCVGDIVAGNFVKEQAEFLFKNIEIPLLSVIGNHDVIGNGANTYSVINAPSETQIFNSFVKPMIDSGILSNGEYQNGKNYWFHDDEKNKIRIIGVYDFDVDPLFDDTYWESVSFNESAPNIEENKNYNSGDVVNAGTYNGCSFKAKSSFKTPSSFNTISNLFPKFSISKCNGIIKKTQADWFLDVLCSTPANYGVVIAKHIPFSDNCTNQKQFKFAQNIDLVPKDDAWLNRMSKDFFANAVRHFIDGDLYEETIGFIGECIPLGTYNVSKNFASKNEGAKFICFVNGHAHKDLIWRHNTFSDILCVSCISMSMGASGESNRDVKVIDIAPDCITTIAPDQIDNCVRLTKIGCKLTTDMEKRDFEKISCGG